MSAHRKLSLTLNSSRTSTGNLVLTTKDLSDSCKWDILPRRGRAVAPTCGVHLTNFMDLTDVEYNLFSFCILLWNLQLKWVKWFSEVIWTRRFELTSTYVAAKLRVNQLPDHRTWRPSRQIWASPPPTKHRRRSHSGGITQNRWSSHRSSAADALDFYWSPFEPTNSPAAVLRAHCKNTILLAIVFDNYDFSLCCSRVTWGQHDI